MSFRKAIFLILSLSVVGLLAGCGSSSSKATAPPSGGFSNSNLNGTYVFSFSGTDNTVSPPAFFTMVGSFAANGSGSISSGAVDIVDPAYGVLTSQTIGSGSGYSVTSDGRGSGILVTTSALGKIGIDFVLRSSSHGLITRFDGNGTGSGTIDLQSSTVTQSSLGSYAFSLSGIDQGSNVLATAGAFTLNGSGTITTGLEDFNDNRNSASLTNLSLTGSVTLGSAGAPGTAVLTATGSPYGTQFDVWPIDATHLKLIETDGVEILGGDAFTQQTSISSGQFVYTMAGLDLNGFLLSAGGYVTYDGSSAISSGFEDINDSGTVATSQTVSGSLTSTGGGRYQLALLGLYNGGVGTSSYTFAAYPSSSGILLLEIDSSGVSAGAAFAQTATTFASSQGYGLNLTGANSAGEVDDIAEFTANSGGTLSNGLIDENDQGSTLFDQKLGANGTYTFDSGGSGRGAILYPATGTLITTLSLEFYVANSSTVIFIDTDSNAQVGVGLFQLQSASDPSSAVVHTASHFSVLRTAATLRSRRKN